MKTLTAISTASVRLLVALAVGGFGECSWAAKGEAVPAWASFVNLPLYFEATGNETGSGFQFVARGQSRSVQLSPQRAMLSLLKVERASNFDRRHTGAPGAVSGRSVAFDFVGANPAAQLVGEGELPGRLNYFIGADPSQWRRGLSTYGRVRAQQIYPGIDLVYYGNQARLEYDFVVQPGAQPAVIAFRVTGADRLFVDVNGDLVIRLGADEVRQLKPVAYQEIAGTRREVRAAYRIGGQTVSFDLGAYDRNQPLVIDPILNLLMFFNGSGSDIAWDVAHQSEGTNSFLFVAGETLSANLPATAGAFTNKYAGGTAVGGDAFVAKLNLNNANSNLVYLTYLGGRAHDGAFSLAVDAEGNAFLTGYTASTNFPIVGTLRTNLNGGIATTPAFQNVDAFVTKLAAGGSNLVYSAFLGGSAADQGTGIAVDAAGVAYVTGFTESTNFPLVNASYTNLQGSSDAFIARVSADGQSFGYSFPIGGVDVDHGESVFADAAGNAYVCGFTRSFDFPVTTNSAYQSLANQTTNASSTADAFLLKVSAAGSLDYGTFLGGNRNDVAFNVTGDATGAIYVCGSTASTNFVLTTTNIYNTLATNTGVNDVFVTKFDATLTNVVYSVAFGGAAKDEAWDLAVDAFGRVCVVGDTFSTDMPVTNMGTFLNRANSGSSDAFVGRLNAAGTALDYLGYLGGSGPDLCYAVKLDAYDNVYFVGQNGSHNFPAAPPLGGTADGFVAKIGVDIPSLTVAKDDGNVVLSWPTVPMYELQSALQLPPTNGWLTLGFLPVLIGDRQTVTLPPTNDTSFFRLRQQ